MHQLNASKLNEQSSTNTRYGPLLMRNPVCPRVPAPPGKPVVVINPYLDNTRAAIGDDQKRFPGRRAQLANTTASRLPCPATQVVV